jgi:hypothetical protein
MINTGWTTTLQVKVTFAADAGYFLIKENPDNKILPPYIFAVNWIRGLDNWGLLKKSYNLFEP